MKRGIAHVRKKKTRFILPDALDASESAMKKRRKTAPGNVYFETMKKEKPERKASMARYTFSTPSMGIRIIRNRLFCRYLKINMHTYNVIAPPSSPVKKSLPSDFL